MAAAVGTAVALVTGRASPSPPCPAVCLAPMPDVNQGRDEQGVGGEKSPDAVS